MADRLKNRGLQRVRFRAVNVSNAVFRDVNPANARFTNVSLRGSSLTWSGDDERNS